MQLHEILFVEFGKLRIGAVNLQMVEESVFDFNTSVSVGDDKYAGVGSDGIFFRVIQVLDKVRRK